MANTRRENRLEELGRVDAEKAYTSKGKRNLKDEKKRISKELKDGGSSNDEKYTGKAYGLGYHIPGLDKKLRKKRPHSSPEGRHRDVKALGLKHGGHVKSRGKALRGGGAEIK